MDKQLQGAWQSDQGVLIVAGEYFSYTAYTEETFNFTYGGSLSASEGELTLTYEYHTDETSKVGSQKKLSIKISGKTLTMGDMKFTRLDDGSPGKLNGAWLFTNRERDGEMGSPRSADNPRKTMKILSGTRFQWIAYNTESGQFMGTGGGAYTTKDGKYIENIDFFSRDQSRVGASLDFDFEIKGKEWHHRGKSSKGDPMYEIWTMRE